jgi:hypothetical protein
MLEDHMLALRLKKEDQVMTKVILNVWSKDWSCKSWAYCEHALKLKKIRWEFMVTFSTSSQKFDIIQGIKKMWKDWVQVDKHTKHTRCSKKVPKSVRMILMLPKVPKKHGTELIYLSSSKLMCRELFLVNLRDMFSTLYNIFYIPNLLMQLYLLRIYLYIKHV